MFTELDWALFETKENAELFSIYSGLLTDGGIQLADYMAGNNNCSPKLLCFFICQLSPNIYF